MKNLILLAFLSFNFSFACHLRAQSFLNGVVKIFSPSEKVVGTGIIVGYVGSEVFIVTANHVVADGTDFYINIPQYKWRSYKATTQDLPFDEDLDIAVLKAVVPEQDAVNYFYFRQANFEHVKKGEKVKCIGYPLGGDIDIIENNSIHDTGFENFYIKLIGGGIQGGFSGGPTVEKKKNRLLGITLKTLTPTDTKILRIDKIISLLDRWKIPKNLVGPPVIPLKKITYAFGAGAVGGIVGGILYNKETNDKYAIYENNRDETAPVYDNIDRDEVLKEAKQFRTRQIISYSAAGAFALAGVLINLKKLKNPNNKDHAVRFSIDPTYDSYTGMQLGIHVNF